MLSPIRSVVDAVGQLACDERIERAGHAPRDEQTTSELALGGLGERDELAEILRGRHDRSVAGEAHSKADHLDVRERCRLGQERRQLVRQHSLAQVAEIDHRDDRVPTPETRGRRVDRADRLELALERDIGVAHGLVREPGVGARSSHSGASTPAARNPARFSSRESASAVAPPSKSARATSGEPQVTLVTPTTSRPPSASTTMRVFSAIFSTSTVTVARMS